MESATVRDVMVSAGHAVPMQIHVVTKAATVREVLETLYRHHIHAVPVIDFDSNCEGLVDILDVLAFLLQVASEPIQSRVTPLSTSLKHDDMDMLLERSDRFNAANVLKEVRTPFRCARRWWLTI